MQYDIEADWHFLDTCNYRCSYCFFPAEVLGRALPAPKAEDWCRGFDVTGLTWLLHMTGGEPSVYPRFAELCAGLTERHIISINTNLTHASILAFGESVDPGRVSFINAGLHYAERIGRKGLEKFIRHHNYLQERAFPIFVSAVATPEVLGRMETIVEALCPAGVRPIPKLLRGAYAGKRYPQAYTIEERSLFRRYARLAREAYSPLLATRSEAPTINPFADEDFLDGAPAYVGRMCEAGRRFVAIRPDGRVNRCSNKAPLGNILDGTFIRRLEPAPCDTSYCFYFCEKHAHASLPVAAARVPASIGAP